MQDRSAGNAFESSTASNTGMSVDLSVLDWDAGLYPLNGPGLDTYIYSALGATVLPDSLPELALEAGLQPASPNRLTPAERRAQSNKLAARRARARKKSRAEGTAAQLAVTAAEVQQLQNKQKALEARNALLEKQAQLGVMQQQPESKPMSPAIVRTPA